MQVFYDVCIVSYELMLKCWALDPEERPTPVDLVATLTPLDGPPPPEEVKEDNSKCDSPQLNGHNHTSEESVVYNIMYYGKLPVLYLWTFYPLVFLHR